MAIILLVDDHEDLLQILSTFLNETGYIVETALSHEKAKNALTFFQPDIILLDVKMNGNDGRELCKEIKEKGSLDVPIILLSASPELLKDFEQCMADDIFEKPFDLKTLIKKVEQVLDKYRGA